ncbi:MAG: hypothetical protein ABIO31_00635 [Candidatus Nitrotoga sp.]
MTFGVVSNPDVMLGVDSSLGVRFGVDNSPEVKFGATVCGTFRAEAETAIMLSKNNTVLCIDIPPAKTH